MYHASCKPCFLVKNKTYNYDPVLEKLRKQRSGRKTRLKIKTYTNKLKSKPCTDCKQTYPPCVMDFDHVRGVKIKPVSDFLSSFKAIDEEIEKCELVCSNCHRIRTQQRRQEFKKD